MILDENSLRARIGEVGNQVHNLACEYLDNENLSASLEAIRATLWDIAALAPTDTQEKETTVERKTTMKDLEMRAMTGQIEARSSAESGSNKPRFATSDDPMAQRPSTRVFGMIDESNKALLDIAVRIDNLATQLVGDDDHLVDCIGSEVHRADRGGLFGQIEGRLTTAEEYISLINRALDRIGSI